MLSAEALGIACFHSQTKTRGFATGFALQCSIGVFASILASFVLVAAEPKRCPLALPNVPFAAYLAGVGVGVAVCEACMDSESNNYNQESKLLLWGFIVILS